MAQFTVIRLGTGLLEYRLATVDVVVVFFCRSSSIKRSSQEMSRICKMYTTHKYFQSDEQFRFQDKDCVVFSKTVTSHFAEQREEIMLIR